MPSVEELFKSKISSKGQVVIPKPIRDSYHLDEGDEIFMIPSEEGVLLKRIKKPSSLRGLLKDLNANVMECEIILSEAKKSLAKVV